MLKNLKDLGRTNHTLAPYAMHARDSLGRFHKEKEDTTRTHSSGTATGLILRLSRSCRQKHRSLFPSTVMCSGQSTHHGSIADCPKVIARSLGLNEDLAEAMALAHDLGHPPFGHGGLYWTKSCGFGATLNAGKAAAFWKNWKKTCISTTRLNLDGLLKHEQSITWPAIKFATSRPPGKPG
ncbi:MAG: HD domain-containing protein [Candidatus Gracilibacteria bacterium]